MFGTKLNRGGFSLIEQVVAIASVAVVSAVVVPAVVNQLDKSEISRIESDLRALEKATKDFRTDVTYWPGEILQLKDPLTTGDRDVFDTAILATVFSDWKGPYFEPKAFANIAAAGAATDFRLTSAAGTFFANLLEDAELTPEGSSTAARFTVIRLNNVDVEDAKKVSESFDGESKLCSGRVQWVSGGTDTATLNGAGCTEPTAGKGVLIYYAGPIN